LRDSTFERTLSRKAANRDVSHVHLVLDERSPSKPALIAASKSKDDIARVVVAYADATTVSGDGSMTLVYATDAATLAAMLPSKRRSAADPPTFCSAQAAANPSAVFAHGSADVVVVGGGL
jgi:hypothetical protein